MKIASRITAIEAIRYQGEKPKKRRAGKKEKQKKERKGYEELSVGKLTFSYNCTESAKIANLYVKCRITANFEACVLFHRLVLQGFARKLGCKFIYFINIIHRITPVNNKYFSL